jgi:hypothetical protein
MYLDDGLGGGASYEDALISSKVIQTTLSQSDIFVSYQIKKS